MKNHSAHFALHPALFSPWLLAALFFLLRLPLLTWYAGEYTDSVLLLTLFQNDNAYYPPLFTLLAGIPRLLGMDATLSGRLVSLAATALCTLPIFHLGRRLGHEGVGLVAVLLFQSAALTNQWAPRAMSDPLFTLLFCACVYYSVLGLQSPRAPAHRGAGSSAQSATWLLFWTGMASLCRYQGWAFLPVLGWMLWWRGERPGWRQSWALVPWLLLAAWMLYRGFGHGTQYLDRGAGSNAALYAYWTWSFIAWLPYALGWVNVGFALVGLWRLRHRGRPFVALTLYLTLVWFAAHVPFLSFQFRYFLPLAPLVAVAAALGWWALYERVSPKLRGFVWTACALWLVYFSAFSALVLHSQREAWGDLRQAAAYLRGLPAETRVFANEMYGPQVRNYKLAFWSGRPISPLHDAWEQLAPGDVVVLISVHDDLSSAMAALGKRWDTEERRTFAASLAPRLGDLMNPPGLTSHPAAMQFRHQRQRFTTLVVHLREK